MSTFKIMFDRIAAELRRSNMTAEIKTAINDAINEAAKYRFYFNEQLGRTFNTVINQEYYDDLGFTDIDAAWYLRGTQRENLTVYNNLDANDHAQSAAPGGQLMSISRVGGKLRLEPIPTTVFAVYLDGIGRLTPYPLVADGDTNAWMTEGEQYVRALAKRNLLRDVIRDYGEARVLEGIAEGYRDDLQIDTVQRSTTDRIRSTEW